MNINCIFGSHKALNPGSLGFMQARNPSGDIVLILELCDRCNAVFWRLPTPGEVVSEREARQRNAAQAQIIDSVNDRKVVPMDHQRKRKAKATPQDYVPKPPPQ